MKKYSSAFTLLELIIVIAILAILATIAFVAYEGYTMSSRDSQRASNIRQIETALSVFRLKSGFYPMPEPKVSGGVVLTGSIDNITYSYLGVIGDTITSLLQAGKAPIDPITNDRYLYGISSNGKYFQISVALEKPTRQARVLGDYPGYMKFTASDSKTYIANIPSLLWNNSGSITLFSTGGTYPVAPYFVVNDQSNLPYTLGDGPVGNTSADTIVQSITKSGVATLTGAEITNVKTFTGVVNLFSGSLLMSFGGDIEVMKMNVLESSYAGSSTPACLELENAGDFTFEEATKTITAYNGNDTDLIIPCKIGGVQVTGIRDDTGTSITHGTIQLTSVSIPNSVTNIGNYTFRGSKLTSVIIPSGVTNIGDAAFYGNKLTSVIIPNSVTTIGAWAFYTNKLTSVTISSGLTSIGSAVFYGNQLTNVTIPSSVTSIGTQAFSSNQISSVTIPSSVTSIGTWAFSFNQLWSVTIPSSVTTIGGSAFYGNGPSNSGNITDWVSWVGGTWKVVGSTWTKQ